MEQVAERTVARQVKKELNIANERFQEVAGDMKDEAVFRVKRLFSPTEY